MQMHSTWVPFFDDWDQLSTIDLDDYNTLYTEKIIIKEDLFLELRKQWVIGAIFALDQILIQTRWSENTVKYWH